MDAAIFPATVITYLWCDVTGAQFLINSDGDWRPLMSRQAKKRAVLLAGVFSCIDLNHEEAAKMKNEVMQVI